MCFTNDGFIAVPGLDERHLFVISRLKGGEIHSALAFLKTPKTQNKSDLVGKWWSSYSFFPAVRKSRKRRQVRFSRENRIKLTFNCLQMPEQDRHGRGMAGEDRCRESPVYMLKDWQEIYLGV
jgi:hypothetical protein